MNKWIRNLGMAAVAALMTLMSGCAFFPAEQLPVVTDMPSVAQYQHKPSVYIEVLLFEGQPDVPGSTPSPVTFKARIDNVEAIVAQAAQQSGLFSSYSFDASTKATADYTIQLSYYDYGNKALAFISGFVTGFTFGIIPGGATDHFELKATLTGKDGASQQLQSYQDATTMMAGIWFIPMMGHTAEKANERTLGNMTLAAFKEMIGKGELKYSLQDRRLHHIALSEQQLAR